MSPIQIQEFWADEIATPRSKGSVVKLRPARLVISKDRILAVEKLSKSKLSFGSKRKIKRFKTLTPGFIDSHTHLVFAGNRADEWNKRLKGFTYQQIASQGGGIQKTMRCTRETAFDELLEMTLQRIDRFFSYGVTTLEAKSGYGLDLESELKILRVIQRAKELRKMRILPTFMGAHAKPKEFSTTTEFVDYLIEKVLPQIGRLAVFQDVFCEKGYFSEADSIRILNEGKKYGLLPKVHAHEFGRTGGVKAAAKVQAVSADHLIHMSDRDIRLLKKAGVVPVVLPGTCFFLGAKEFSPARAMLNAGLPVAIASDFNPGTNPTQNFPLMGSFAAIYQDFSLEEVLTAQTWNGARALRIYDRGCLEPNMKADFVAWDHASYEEIYYSYGNSKVTSVYLGGEKVL